MQEIRNLVRLGWKAYLANIWSWVELTIIALTGVAIGLYIRLRIVEQKVINFNY